MPTTRTPIESTRATMISSAAQRALMRAMSASSAYAVEAVHDRELREHLGAGEPGIRVAGGELHGVHVGFGGRGIHEGSQHVGVEVARAATAHGARSPTARAGG